MVLERFSFPGKEYRVTARKVYLRTPRLSDWRAWAEVRAVSRNHLVPWEPVWAPDTLTKASFRNRLRRYARDARDDMGQAFFIFRHEDDQIVGSVTLSNIRRGVAQTGTIGYWTGLPYARQGYMYDALTALLPVLFRQYGLRRVEAACVPENDASAALLEKVGFIREGRAREYLCINGEWRDHLLFACLKDDPLPLYYAGDND
ncbi:GNAT family N-acetyltransferase [Sneathiella chinensis]|uniref:Ribosomal-protein-alanine N-acetyltransferase n=1 Tax=Sneathiella chinensis TaxID=349750 RepID=A0ABQ5U2N5_9PROT|nr:GNAT family protein [Sneathiella chinensis]GLQ05676.1 ribosomal-protein-alanine N-acetyltransferase [Sneathiella chinensis]